MDVDKHLAAWMQAQLNADGPVHDLAQRIDPHWAMLTVKLVSGLAAYLLGENAHELHTTLEVILRQSEPLEPGHGQPADTRSEQAKAGEQVKTDEQARAEQAKAGEQAKAEQAKAEQLKAVEQEKTEQLKAVEQAKAEHIKADAELAAAVIEEQTIVVEQEIAKEPGKSAAEIDALYKEFEREKKELEGKIDGLAKNYFGKHPDLSDDERTKAEDRFKDIKEEELGTLRGQQEARMEELTRTQQQQREELEERRKELEGTRAGRLSGA